MSERRIDRVTIDLNRGPVVIPWASREALLAECRKLDAMGPVIAEFRNGGTSRPIRLTDEARAGLLGVIVAWTDEADGLPEGIAELCDAIEDDSPEP